MPPKRKQTQDSCLEFWGLRPSTISALDLNLQTRRISVQQDSESRANNLLRRRDAFLNSYVSQRLPNNFLTAMSQQTCDDLTFWLKYLSWSFCPECKQLQRHPLLPSFAARTLPTLKKCFCSQQRYVVPRFNDIPHILRNLTFENILILRPFDIDAGQYRREQHGYRVKTGAFSLTASPLSVQQKIEHLQDDIQKNLLRGIYHFLFNSDDSSYQKIVELREDMLQEGKTKMSLLNLHTLSGVECALWPHVYPFSSWCESNIDGSATRLSSKVSFNVKLSSEISDFALSYEMLLFHYDRWLFKTITGAINSGRVFDCSPATSLDAKTFSPGYWKWQHSFLLDAVLQYGMPSLFITFSPSEWSFPVPQWLENMRETCAAGPTRLPGPETLAYAHALEQIVRGYLTGSNDARWCKNVFSHNNEKNVKNILTYFYRFEFQQRGTLHLHLLVWLKCPDKIQYKRIRADIPKGNAEAAFLVERLQKSNKPSSFLTLSNDPTHLESGHMRVSHDRNAFAVNLRAYVDTLLPTLKCSMDVQLSDGRSMILRYVSSYVSKWSDALDEDALYSRTLDPYHAAYKYLCNLRPCEPEMVFALSSFKVAWSTSRTKRFTAPHNADVANNNCSVERYRARPANVRNLSLLEWLRAYDNSARDPKPYKKGSTLVGVKYCSFFRREFFFQYVLVNYPHCSAEEIDQCNFNNLPVTLKNFVIARTLFPNMFGQDQTQLEKLLTDLGHKDFFVENVLSFVSCLNDAFRLWSIGRMHPQSLILHCTQHNFMQQLEGKQLVILENFKQSLVSRDLFITSDHEELDPIHHSWTSFLLVTGEPGTGKSRTLNACIQHALSERKRVLVCAPTGFLARCYSGIFGEEICTETVHAAFKINVVDTENGGSARNLINWILSSFDVILMDEVSMVSKCIFNHVIATVQSIAARPVVVLCGDEAQQQPIDTVEGKIVSVPSVFDHPNLSQICRRHNLTTQYRCHDPLLVQILQHLRHWPPTNEILARLNSSRRLLFSRDDTVDCNKIFNHFVEFPQCVILTVSRNTCWEINKSMIKLIFSDHEEDHRLLLSKVPFDVKTRDSYEQFFAPLYVGMRVMFTQNRNKETGFVNGETGVVSDSQGPTIFVTLSNGNIIPVYKITFWDGDVRRCCYPMAPRYAITICKVQGQTLDNVLLWLDTEYLSAATTYVALSRVKSLNDLYLIKPITKKHFMT